MSKLGPALAWFYAYLDERYQHVKVNLKVSGNTSLLCGVHQGSVLGPVLFTIYTAQLGNGKWEIS